MPPQETIQGLPTKPPNILLGPQSPPSSLLVDLDPQAADPSNPNVVHGQQPSSSTSTGEFDISGPLDLTSSLELDVSSPSCSRPNPSNSCSNPSDIPGMRSTL